MIAIENGPVQRDPCSWKVSKIAEIGFGGSSWPGLLHPIAGVVPILGGLNDAITKLVRAYAVPHREVFREVVHVVIAYSDGDLGLAANELHVAMGITQVIVRQVLTVDSPGTRDGIAARPPSYGVLLLSKLNATNRVQSPSGMWYK
jgi:hypothetical protein